MHANGNDFVIIDNRTKNYNLKKNIIFYKKWDNYLKKLEDKKKS